MINKYVKKRPVGQVVKTPPFHGDNMGSNPVGVTTLGRLAQLGERLPYKQDVGSSILSSPTIGAYLLRPGSLVG